MNLQKRYLLMGGAVLAILLTLAAGLLFWGRRPFRGLEAADIAAATVLVGPPDVTLELDAGEIETLADLLADVRITRPDQSYSEYAGQTVLFTVTMADGTAANVTAYNPFLIIDGTGWRTAYAPCEALNRFANELLRESRFSSLPLPCGSPEQTGNRPWQREGFPRQSGRAAYPS